jgi:alcohol dehydrogenase
LWIGHYPTLAAKTKTRCPGSTVAVVSDGGVGLLGMLSAKLMEAERIIAMRSARNSHASSAQRTS